jgi:hypothetical protein
MEVKTRVDNQTLINWIDSKVPPTTPEPRRLSVKSDVFKPSNGILNGFTLNFIMMGAPEGERNQTLFKAACDMAKCGYEEDEAIDMLQDPSGLDYQEVSRTIRSAFRKVQSEN